MPIVAEDQAYFLRVIDRSYPSDYIASIQAKPNGGYELFQSAAAVSARVSLAISRKYSCSFLASAGGGTYATGTVQFSRAVATAGAITLLAGTKVGTADGRVFVTTQPAVFTALALGPVSVTVQAVAVGYEYNVPGQVVTAGGETLEGAITRIVRLATSPPAIDPAMQVAQLVATTGGAAACLDGLGNDVNIPRSPQESDAAYRVRIRTTPDTVSPDAIQRGLNAILGVHACLREVGTPKLPGFFYDAGSSLNVPQNPANNYAYDIGLFSTPQPGLVYDGTIFDLVPLQDAYDTTAANASGAHYGGTGLNVTGRATDRFKVYLDIAHFRGFMLIGVPPVVETSPGLVYDGALANPFPLRDAYDTTAANEPGAAYDAVNVTGPAVRKAVYDMVNGKRAAGVIFELYQETIGCV